jgi:hypothetical protein
LLQRGAKSRQVGEAELAAVDVQAAELGAAVESRKNLAGVEDLGGIEGALVPLVMAFFRPRADPP